MDQFWHKSKGCVIILLFLVVCGQYFHLRCICSQVYLQYFAKIIYLSSYTDVKLQFQFLASNN